MVGLESFIVVAERHREAVKAAAEFSSLLQKAPLIEVNSSLEIRKKAFDLLGYGSAVGFAPDVVREVQEKLDEFGYDFLVTAKVHEYQIAKSPLRRSRELWWKMVAIEKIALPIPDFALSKAVQLKEAFPSARFFCEVFEDGPDPFLVMLYKDCTFYVEVWVEPEFEGRQIVPDSKGSERPRQGALSR
jgi:hypothetical protein